jgi:glycerate-2-kinase
MSLIVNRASLLGHGMQEVREVALSVVEAGLAAIDPAAAVARHASLEGDDLVVDGRRYDLRRVRRLLVLGAGKASLAVAGALVGLLGDRISDGCVVVPAGQARALRRIRVLEGSHPIPDPRSLKAARALVELADAARPDDLVLTCVTGGSSALVSLPPEGVDLEEKRALHRLLLESGATIGEINAVRKHVSDVKGGRLAARMARAPIVNLTVSDVAGDPPDLITDLTVQDTSTTEDAVQVLHAYRLWDAVAGSIRRHLSDEGAARSPDLSGRDIHTVMMATGDTACRAMADRARALGYAPVPLTSFLEGESREVGRVLAAVTAECARKRRPFAPPCVLLGCGGETTVTLTRGELGLGGPNQEVALGFALGLQPADRVAGVFVDTDGIDGGTAAAGAIADGSTRSRARELGLNLGQELRLHRSGSVLNRLEDLVMTGPTGTNLNDMFAIAVAGEGTVPGATSDA